MADPFHRLKEAMADRYTLERELGARACRDLDDMFSLPLRLGPVTPLRKARVRAIALVYRD